MDPWSEDKGGKGKDSWAMGGGSGGGESGEGGGEPNAILDAIAALSTKIDKMVLKEDLEKMRTDINVKTKESIAMAVVPIVKDVEVIQKRLESWSYV